MGVGERQAVERGCNLEPHGFGISLETVEFRGGPGQNRTADTLIFSQVLYQLSYRATAAGS